MIDVKCKQLLQETTVAEFFAGIGLVRLGLEAAGWKVLFANDISQDKQQLYTGHFNDDGNHFRLKDIHLLDAKDIPTVTLATASFPCTDLSLAGMRVGLSGKHSSAYWGFVRILDELGPRRPPFVLLENVAGFLTSHGGKDFQEALLALNRLGYSVDAFIIDAVRFVPQSRVRLFVVGTLNTGPGARNINETISFYQSPVRPKILADYIFQHPQIAWKTRNMPDPPCRTTHALEDIVETLPEDDKRWWNEKRTDYLRSQMSEKHTAVSEQMINRPEWSYGTVFRRVRHGLTRAELRSDGIAGCLRTPKGGSAKQILFRAGYGRAMCRLLTPTECARLMGAPEFMLDGIPPDKAFFGFGDAVCVPVIRWIADNYFNPLIREMLHEGENHPERECKWQTRTG